MYCLVLQIVSLGASIARMPRQEEEEDCLVVVSLLATLLYTVDMGDLASAQVSGVCLNILGEE